jgi:glyoxylase-like metal-dependent hydrolase (beta-lactamase superfamily II)
MFILDGGTLLYDRGLMKFGMDMGKMQRIFTPFFAFDTEEGWVLYDTGWPIIAVPVLEAIGLEPEISEENLTVAQLKRIGVEPSDVSKIILSHLHVDHAGGLQSFLDADVYVQKDEHAYAMHPNSFQALAYAEETFNIPQIKWNFLEGDDLILPGLAVFMAPGHTAGLQCLIAELPESGFYVLAADAAYLQENLDENLPGGSSWNPVLAQYAIKRVKMLSAILGGQYFPGHDYDFFTSKVKLAEEYI